MLPTIKNGPALVVSLLVLWFSAGAIYQGWQVERWTLFGVASAVFAVALYFAVYFLCRLLGIVKAGDEASAVEASGGLAVISFRRSGWIGTAEQHAAKVRDAARNLSHDDLLAAFHNPDIAPDVSRALADELTARGLAGEAVTNWIAPAERLAVPSALPAGSDAASYLARVRVRSVLIGLGRVLMIASAILLPAVILLNLLHLTPPPQLMILVWPLTLALGLFLHDWTHRTLAMIVAAYATLTLLLAATGFRVPGLGPAEVMVGCFLIAPLVTHGRRARILLLRPFGPTEMSAALKRAVRRNIGGLGAVFTLSDKNYKPSTTMGILRFVGAWGGILGLLRHLLGPLVRPSLRIATVVNEPTYRLLAHEASRNLVLDFKSSYCGDQAFNIASSDRWWQYCIDFLIHSTDFVVMDISRVSAGSTWEIVRLVRRQSHERCIFIAHEDYASVAMDGLEKLLPAGFTPELHLFRESGELLKPDAFAAAVQRTLTESLVKAGASPSRPLG